MVRGQAVSPLSVRAWCCRHGLKEPTFYWWRAELARRDPGGRRRKISRRQRMVSATRRRSAFVPVGVAEAAPGGAAGSIEIGLANGRCVRIRGPLDRQILAEVLAVLEAPAC
jgi:hypothetical protein